MARKKKSKSRWLARFRSEQLAHQLVWLGVLATLAVLSALEPHLWLGALINELGFHIALLALLGAALAVYKRAYLVVLGSAATVVLFGWPLYPLYRTAHPTPQAGPTLRVATAHLAGQPLDEATLTAWLERHRPDIASLTGLTSTFDAGSRLGVYRLARGNDDLRTLLVVQNALVVPTRERPSEHPMVTVRAGRCQARTVGIELPPLGAYTAFDARERAIAAVASLKSAPRSIWLGHLGSRPEAHDLRSFIKAHALRDARIGHGRLASAPGSFGPLGFPLSDVLVHGWISVRDASVSEPIVGGAQRTISAVLELTEPRCRFSTDAPLE